MFFSFFDNFSLDVLINSALKKKNAAKRSRQHARIQRKLSFNERTRTRGGRTHNVTQRTDTHIFFDETHKLMKLTNAQSHILKQHAA